MSNRFVQCAACGRQLDWENDFDSRFHPVNHAWNCSMPNFKTTGGKAILVASKAATLANQKNASKAPHRKPVKEKRS